MFHFDNVNTHNRFNNNHLDQSRTGQLCIRKICSQFTLIFESI